MVCIFVLRISLNDDSESWQIEELKLASSYIFLFFPHNILGFSFFRRGLQNGTGFYRLAAKMLLTRDVHGKLIVLI